MSFSTLMKRVPWSHWKEENFGKKAKHLKLFHLPCSALSTIFKMYLQEQNVDSHTGWQARLRRLVFQEPGARYKSLAVRPGFEPYLGFGRGASGFDEFFALKIKFSTEGA